MATPSGPDVGLVVQVNDAVIAEAPSRSSTATCRVSPCGSKRCQPFASKLLRLRDLLGRHHRGDPIPISYRVSVPAGRGQTEPHVRGDIVLRDAEAVGVLEPETGSRVSLALIGHLAIPTRGGSIVLRDAQAVGKLEPEPVLSEGVALLGRLAIPASP
jgi:hypothetical protein